MRLFLFPIVSYSSVDLKSNCLQFIAKTNKLALPFKYVLKGVCVPILYISRKSQNIKNSHFPWVLCYNTATIRQQYCELFIYQKQPTAFSAVKTCEQMETGSKMCQQISSCITGCVCVSVLTMGNSSRARCETLCVAHALSLSVMPAEGGTILKPV